MLSRTSLAAVAAGVLAASGCGGRAAVGSEPAEAPYDPRVEAPLARASVAPKAPVASVPAAQAPRPVGADGCESPRIRPLRTRSLAFAAVVRTSARVYARPGGAASARFGRLNANGVATVFGVLGRTWCGGEWLRVQVPAPPNGSLGWVRARDVELVRVRTRIEVDLSRRRVTLYLRGRALLGAEAAVGAADTPTPTGSYYVNQRLVAPDARGPFGPAAIGISAFSPVLQDWIQGGPIAIHGTNRPDLLGGAVSHGCVRVRNDVLVRMFRLAGVGTPVVIRA